VFISSILCNFGGKIHTIRIKLVEFDWKKAFIKAEKSLDITLFLVQLKFILSKPGLKKKGREKGRVWIEIQCNISHLAKRKNALNQRFSYVLIRIEPLLNFCKNKIIRL